MFSRRPSRSAFPLRLLLTTALTGAAFATVGAASAAQSGQIDLAVQAGAHFDGAGFLDGAGTSVAPAGDVNGDGRPDVIVGAPFRDGPGGFDAGAAYVIFGTSAPRTVDFANLGTAGFLIDGETGGDRAGISVASAGDVNGDGRADIIVGANGNDRTETNAEGAAYVVFGKATVDTVSLSALGDGGFKIQGAFAGDRAGNSVAGIGDVNDDGVPDVAVGALDADDNPLEVEPGDRENAGTVFIVHGKSTTTTVDLAALTNGYMIAGARVIDQEAGTSIAAIGDVNSDGRADVLVGAPGSDPLGRDGAGAAYVVYSPAPSESLVDLEDLGAGGYVINGASAGDAVGTAVAGAGDLNGDGLPDLLVGAPAASPSGRSGAGIGYVVYSGTTAVDLASPGGRAAAFTGGAAGDLAGSSFASPGDLNGDGVGDVMIGAPGASPAGRAGAGAAYLLTTVSSEGGNLGELGGDALVVSGAAAGDAAGTALAAPGDFNGDKTQDLVVGAPGATRNGRTDSGTAYLLLGLDKPDLAYAPTRVIQGQPVNMVATLFATGPATLSVNPPLPPGLSIDPVTGAITGTPTMAGSSTHAVTVTDATGTSVVTLIFNIGPPGSTPAFSGSISSAPLCLAGAAAAAAETKEPGTVRLTAAQLRINQRIGQAAIRRLNAVEKWLSDGIETRDLCGGAIGAQDLSAGITVAPAEASGVQPPNPRPLAIPAPRIKSGAEIVVSRTQLLINQRIYQAAIRRGRALEARLNGNLTGGDIEDGAITTNELASGLEVVAAVADPPPPPSATKIAKAAAGGEPGKVSATASQLRINQRVARAGIRSANRLRGIIASGLTGANFADEAITVESLAPEVTAAP